MENKAVDIPGFGPASSSNPMRDNRTLGKDEEDKRIKALVETPVLDWQCQMQDHFGSKRDFRKGLGGRVMTSRGLGYSSSSSLSLSDQAGLPWKTPPEGYVCHRCSVPGHFIQHCPTNGDPDYDIKRVKCPTGLPKSMLRVTLDGSYAMPMGDVAVLMPNEAAFEKEMGALASTRSVTDVPPELHCPLCKDVMKDAMVTSKCCLSSFCDKCIRGYIISKAKCFCGATNILADDLIPNKTLRGTIMRILEFSASGLGNTGSLVHFHDVESAPRVQESVPSSTLTTASEHELKQSRTSCSPILEEGEGPNEGKKDNVVVHSLEKNDAGVMDLSEAKPLPVNTKEAISQENVNVTEGVQEKLLLCGEQGKKMKKKKRTHLPETAQMQWGCDGMPLAPSAYYTYMAGCPIPWGIDGYTRQFMTYMGYTPGPFDDSFGRMFLQDPFRAQAYVLPGPRGDISKLGIRDSINQRPLVVGGEGFKSEKSDPSRKNESKRFNEREHLRDMEMDRKVSSSSVEISPIKSRNKPVSSNAPSERLHLAESYRGQKGKSTSHHCSPSRNTPDCSSSRILSRDGVASRKRETPERASGLMEPEAKHHRTTPKTCSRDPLESTSILNRTRSIDYDRDLSEEYHFKRRPLSSHHGDQDWEEERDWHSSRWRECDHERRRERDRGQHWCG